MIRVRRVWIALAVIALVPAAALAWWLASPLFLSTTAQEEFPMAARAAVPANMSRAEVEQILSGMSKVDQEMSEGTPAAMSAARKLRAGTFRDADSFHRGSGEAAVYRLPDGSHVLRLESFKVTNGPDLYVILTPHATPTGPADVRAPGHVELGKLKGNMGSQNYDIPAGVSVDAQMSVVIYCRPFQVIFSIAPLLSAG